jgi:hypothetical protein
MQQDLVSIAVTKELQTAVLGLVAQINQQLPGLITLPAAERRGFTMMGPKSERYARGVLLTLQQNADIVPRSIDVGAAVADLEALDNLLPILKAVQQLAERLEDTTAALGSDVMVVANIGYGLMKSVGRSAGLDDILKELSYRHAKSRRKTLTPASSTDDV